jgi:hypothetical protein
MKNLKNLTRTPLFWISQFILFLVFSALSFHFYPKAFPIVDFKIEMNRSAALKTAETLAKQHQWGPEPFRQAVSFDLDSATQTFVELSAGGPEAFSKIIQNGLYSPFTWKVRHFAEAKTNETVIRFTPQGDFYGFHERVSEDAPGKALSPNKALEIAETTAVQNWKLPLKNYQLIEKSQEERPNHRIDHTFVYERPNQQLGDGRYRLKLMVTGDRLTEIHYFIKVPEAFSRKYAEMRSANNTIATLASLAMGVLYLLLGCGVGIFLLARKHWVIWKTPLIMAGIVSVFQLLEQLNQLPLLWMSYDTALSASGFLMRNATSTIIMVLFDFLLLTVSFMAAESLTRKAFPSHPQLWRIWYPQNASSISILGRTLGGYLSVGFFFAFVVVMYYVGRKSFGWWSPSDTLFHPDGLATYCPWFTSISNSLHAGFWEECLFRAVPLAGAALLGKKYGNRKAWIIAGFIVQALIFAAAHANYPTQPSYARVVELLIPSFIFGGIYLLFGLLPGIILHFTFDVVSFAIPLFTTSTPGIWADRFWVVVISLVPLWIVLGSRIKERKWKELKPQEWNQAWTPAGKKHHTPSSQRSVKAVQLKALHIYSLLLICLISLCIWGITLKPKHTVPSLMLSRGKAIQLAHTALEENGIYLSPAWQSLAMTYSEGSDQDRFVWKTEGKEVFQKLMGSYLAPPAWLVRFVRFDTNVDERAEEYQVYLVENGEVFQIRHELPEARKGVELEQPEAKKTALGWIQKFYHLDPKSLKEVTSRISKLPNRKDWLFIFSDPSIQLKKGEARIGVHVAGNRAISSRRFVFVPEDWERAETNRENQLSIIRIISFVVLSAIFIGGLVFSLMSWTRKHFEVRSFLLGFGFLASIGVLTLVNDIPGQYAHFSTVEPRINQVITWVGFGLLKTLFFALFCGLIIGYLHHQSTQKNKLPKKNAIILGYSVGFLGALIINLSHRIFPAPVPSAGRIGALEDYLPALSSLKTIEQQIVLTLVFALVGIFFEKLTRHWTQKKGLGIAFLTLFGLAICGVDTDSVSSWIVCGLIVSTYFSFVYIVLLRSRLNLLPFTAGAMIILSEFKQISLHPYVGFYWESLLVILGSILLSYFWFERWNKHSHP